MACNSLTLTYHPIVIRLVLTLYGRDCGIEPFGQLVRLFDCVRIDCEWSIENLYSLSAILIENRCIAWLSAAASDDYHSEWVAFNTAWTRLSQRINSINLSIYSSVWGILEKYFIFSGHLNDHFDFYTTMTYVARSMAKVWVASVKQAAYFE